jgi:indolepyruvate ferredoxin oxidoreductase alpha subunit
MKKMLQGNEAIARGAREAGVVVGCACPGTPGSEIMVELSKYKEIFTEWSPNEKVAMEVAHGASLAGGRAMACMKHVGLNVGTARSAPVHQLGEAGRESRTESVDDFAARC